MESSWPIRVGGEYRSKLWPDMTRKVTALTEERVDYLVLPSIPGKPLHVYCDPQIFCDCSLPEETQEAR